MKKMWNLILYFWVTISLLSLVYVFYQTSKGKQITKREVGFFYLGLFIAGTPFIYVVIQ
jgi:RsiW-degrading membrane proteinase PrsW (M82 family)